MKPSLYIVLLVVVSLSGTTLYFTIYGWDFALVRIYVLPIILIAHCFVHVQAIRKRPWITAILISHVLLLTASFLRVDAGDTSSYVAVDLIAVQMLDLFVFILVGVSWLFVFPFSDPKLGGRVLVAAFIPWWHFYTVGRPVAASVNFVLVLMTSGLLWMPAAIWALLSLIGPKLRAKLIPTTEKRPETRSMIPESPRRGSWPNSGKRIDRPLFFIVGLALSLGMIAGWAVWWGGIIVACDYLWPRSNLCGLFGIFLAPVAFIVVTLLVLLLQVRHALTLPRRALAAYVVIVILGMAPFVGIWIMYTEGLERRHPSRGELGKIIEQNGGAEYRAYQHAGYEDDKAGRQTLADAEPAG